MSDKFYFKRTLEMVSEFDGAKSINHAEKLNNDPVMFDYTVLESNGIYVGLNYLVGDDGLDDMGLFLPLTNLLDEFIERKDPDELGDVDSIHDINELVCEFELCIAKLKRLKARIIKDEVLTKQ